MGKARKVGQGRVGQGGAKLSGHMMEGFELSRKELSLSLSPIPGIEGERVMS
jgi:hypothetical protein